MPSLVGLEQLRNIGHQRIIRVGVGKEGADTEKYLGDGQCRAPLILENIQTNTSIGVDVAVINACGEMDFRGL